MKVGLFIPCYINAVYPEVGIASYKLLRHVGVDVDYPMDQTCCGQPMANAGFEDEAARLALRMEEQFKNYDYVVGPSASCVAFVKENHPHILEKRDHVCMNSKKIYDICEFLHDVVRPESLPAVFPHKVSIHNSCHGVRELHLSSPSERNIPYYSKLRDLLSLVKGIEVFEPKVSTCMGQDKVKDHMSTVAEYITGAESSCLMHMEGVIKREKLPIKTIHIVQILASGL